MKQLFANQKGQSSMMRFALFFVVCVIMIVWGILSVKSGNFIEFTDSSLYLLGLCLGGKVGEKIIELLNKEKQKEVTIVDKPDPETIDSYLKQDSKMIADLVVKRLRRKNEKKNT